VAIKLQSVDEISQSAAGDINASVLNRPIQQLSVNVQILARELETVSASRNIISNSKCTAAVKAGIPVSWSATGKEFEPALSGSRPAVGICTLKHADTMCDVQMGGFIQAIDLTESTGVAIPAAGLYYLSQTTAGKMVNVRPIVGIQHPVMFADGQGGAYLYNSGEYLPLQGLQGIQGIPGATGATGAAGATGATGPAALPSLASGRWYTGPLSYAPAGINANLPGNQLLAIPFAAPGGATIKELGVKILGAGDPGSEGKLGIYKDLNNYPGELLSASNGVFNGGSAGPKSVSVIDTVLTAGQLVWLVVLANSSLMGLFSFDRTSAWAFMGWGDGFADPVIGYAVDFPYATLPSIYPSSANELVSVVPAIFAKVK